MDYLFVGIDISKDKFDLCILDGNHQVLQQNAVLANTSKGIKQLLSLLTAHGIDGCWVCMEHTGHYGALLASELASAGVRFSLVNPLEIKRSSGLTRGKNDAVDAYRIASYAVRHQYKLKPYRLAGKALQQLKVKLSQRAFYTKMLIQNKNNLKSLEVLAQSSSCGLEIRTAKASIRNNERIIARLDAQLLKLIEAAPELKATFDKITQLDGIGLVTAATCIVETDNFQRFSNARKFCCHAGLAPFDYQSGSSIRSPKRTSPFRNKALKALLIRAGMTAGVHDPQLNAYKKRKRKQGKHAMVVNNALAAKLVARMFAVVAREEPYVKLAA